MFKDKELIERISDLEKRIEAYNTKMLSIQNAFEEYFKVELRSEDAILERVSPFSFFGNFEKYIGKKYKLVPLKKEKKTIKKKNKKSKK